MNYDRDFRYVISKTHESNVSSTKVTDTEKDNEEWVGFIAGNEAMGFNKRQLVKIRNEINKLLGDK